MSSPFIVVAHLRQYLGVAALGVEYHRSLVFLLGRLLCTKHSFANYAKIPIFLINTLWIYKIV